MSVDRRSKSSELGESAPQADVQEVSETRAERDDARADPANWEQRDLSRAPDAEEQLPPQKPWTAEERAAIDEAAVNRHDSPGAESTSSEQGAETQDVPEASEHPETSTSPLATPPDSGTHAADESASAADVGTHSEPAGRHAGTPGELPAPTDDPGERADRSENRDADSGGPTQSEEAGQPSKYVVVLDDARSNPSFDPGSNTWSDRQHGDYVVIRPGEIPRGADEPGEPHQPTEPQERAEPNRIADFVNRYEREGHTGHSGGIDVSAVEDASLRDLAGKLAARLPERWRPEWAERPDRTDVIAFREVEVDRPSATGAWKPGLPKVEWADDLTRRGAKLFDGPPSRSQVSQGFLGDCGVMATLSAVAGHRPEAIRDAVRAKPDGRFEVQLRDAHRWGDGYRPDTADGRKFALTRDLPVLASKPTKRSFEQSESTGWAAMLEKALAADDQDWFTSQQLNFKNRWEKIDKPKVDELRKKEKLPELPNDASPPTGYDRLHLGSTAMDRAEILARLTGKESVVKAVPDGATADQDLLSDLAARLADRKPIICGSRAKLSHEIDLDHSLVPGHAYDVVKVENDRIHLHNPWNINHPAPLTAAEFREYFRGYYQDRSGNTVRHGAYTTLA